MDQDWSWPNVSPYAHSHEYMKHRVLISFHDEITHKGEVSPIHSQFSFPHHNIHKRLVSSMSNQIDHSYEEIDLAW